MKKHNNKKINKTKRKQKWSKVPFVLQIIFMALLICGAIVVIGFIINEFKNNPNQSVYVQLLLGLAATILSLVIAINATASSISNKVVRKKEDARQKTSTLTEFINIFNNSYLAPVNRQLTILKYIQDRNNFNFSFDVSLNNQEEKIKMIDDYFSNNKIVFLEEYLYYCTAMSFGPDVNFNDNVSRFKGEILKARKNKKDMSTYVNSIGGLEIIRFFRKERIDILNFFENVAISYFNETLSRIMVDSQFKSMLARIIPMFYYLIYKDEGLDCYPYLNMMLKYMFEE